jgi:hypothetical protein
MSNKSAGGTTPLYQFSEYDIRAIFWEWYKRSGAEFPQYLYTPSEDKNIYSLTNRAADYFFQIHAELHSYAVEGRG